MSTLPPRPIGHPFARPQYIEIASKSRAIIIRDPKTKRPAPIQFPRTSSKEDGKNVVEPPKTQSEIDFPPLASTLVTAKAGMKPGKDMDQIQDKDRVPCALQHIDEDQPSTSTSTATSSLVVTPTLSAASNDPSTGGASIGDAAEVSTPKLPSPDMQQKGPILPVHGATCSGTDLAARYGGRPLDRFACTFIPLWLQSLPPPQRTYRLPTRRPFPPLGYGHDHFSPRHLSTRPNLDTVCPSFLHSMTFKADVPPLVPEILQLSPAYYALHFSALLVHAMHAQIAEAQAAKLHIASLHLHTERQRERSGAYPSSIPAMGPQTFRVHIPGVREDAPRLAIGDKLELRGLHPELQLPSVAMVEAEVVGLSKAQGLVYLKSAELAFLDESLPRNTHGATSYAIEFAVTTLPACLMQDAVRRFSLAFERKQEIARRWLFPQPSDLVELEHFDEAQIPALIWNDQGLNEEQQDAIIHIVTRTHSVPYLISGPPGTGKTRTLVEAALQILSHDPSSHILICAPSNPAADTVARRLARFLKPTEMFRFNAPNRTFAEVPDLLLPHCQIVDNEFGLPPLEDLLKFKVVVCQLQDGGYLQQAHASNEELGRAVDGMRRLVRPHEQSKEESKCMMHWTHLLVDEAAQASEPEQAIALSVVLPHSSFRMGVDKPPTVVLCGDIHQLGPIITSEVAREGELDVSLLQRLFESDTYAKHPSAPRPLNSSVSSAKDRFPPRAAAPFTHLLRNYRSIRSILMVPSSMFYNDRLIPAARDVGLMQWSKLPNPALPILFQGSDSEEYCIDEGASWFNPGEIETVLELIRSLLAERPAIRQSEIAVITPWREQVWQMRARLRSEGYHGVDVGNVETYQGGEFRVTILSCVRSNPRFLPEDKRTNMGFYNEPKRFNVAITRAKELLVVVGNANLLKTDSYWNGFLQIMLRHGLYRGPELDIEQTGAYISHIESEYVRDRDRSGGGQGADEDRGLFLAGEMARTLLSE